MQAKACRLLSSYSPIDDEREAYRTEGNEILESHGIAYEANNDIIW